MPKFGDLEDNMDVVIFDFSDMRHISKHSDVHPDCKPIAFWKGKGPLLYRGSLENVVLAASQQMANTIRVANVSIHQQWSIIENQGAAIKDLSFTNERLRAMVDATQAYLQMIRDDYKKNGLDMPGLMSSEDVKEFKDFVDEVKDDGKKDKNVQKVD